MKVLFQITVENNYVMLMVTDYDQGVTEHRAKEMTKKEINDFIDTVADFAMNKELKNYGKKN